ncbi:uncharacterized protein LOC129892531 [Solanum dulcamara]|uniref:uncharacterized protein LOC129892531 n=1 Tax=Solanum dulcamara TaxID=45834 RepID=UPI00248659B3|nr:uncharacterized protein LOC129892531 [Solanum dulcamara]
MDVEAAEIQDWEMLPSNRASDSEPLATDGSAENTNGVDEVGSETIGVIQPNYFSLDSQIRYMSTFTGADGSEEDSEKSDNPSWIDPGSENNELTMNTCREFWSDSGSEVEGKNELVFEEMKSENVDEFLPDSMKFGADAGQNRHLQEVSVEENQDNGNFEGEHNGNVEGEQRDAGDQKKNLVCWWKVPIQLVKYCAAFRVSPVWTFSVAAAMALVLLGRRLYKMKKKTKPLELKVTVDHKKVSQFTSRAARLNEAFSIVKRVPLIRPQLPAAGDTMWPVMSLR